MEARDSQYEFADTQAVTQASGLQAVENLGAPGMTDEEIITQPQPMMTRAAAHQQRERAAMTGQTHALISSTGGRDSQSKHTHPAFTNNL